MSVSMRDYSITRLLGCRYVRMQVCQDRQGLSPNWWFVCACVRACVYVFDIICFDVVWSCYVLCFDAGVMFCYV